MIKDLLLGAAAVLLASSAYAEPTPNADLENKFFSDIQCRAEVFRELDGMKATREWSMPQGRGMDGSRTFQSPTDIVGVWVEARVFMNKEVLLRRITAEQVETRTVNLANCDYQQSAQKSRELFDKPAPSARVFTDDDLRKLLRDNGRGLIYIWSPNMPYSYQQVNGVSGVEAAREVGRRLGLQVTVVLDPGASGGYARQVVTQNSYMRPDSLRSARSVELALRSMNNHYPSLLVYSNGQIARHGYPGVGTMQEYVNHVRRVLNAQQK